MKSLVTRDFLYEVTCIGGDYSNPIDFCDRKRRASVEIPKVDVNDAQNICKRTHCNVSPNGPTSSTSASQVMRMASLPHHSTCLTGPSAPTDVESNSARFRWKSVETTQSMPDIVNRPSDFPLGDGAICVNGPRDKRWSIASRLSTERTLDSTESRTSTWRDIVRSGGMRVQTAGGSERSTYQLG